MRELEAGPADDDVLEGVIVDGPPPEPEIVIACDPAAPLDPRAFLVFGARIHDLSYIRVTGI